MEGIIFHSEKSSSWALPVVLLAKSHTDASNSYWKNVLQMCQITVNVSNINYKTETCHSQKKKTHGCHLIIFDLQSVAGIKDFFFLNQHLSVSSLQLFWHTVNHTYIATECKKCQITFCILFLSSNYDQSAFKISESFQKLILVIKT